MRSSASARRQIHSDLTILDALRGLAALYVLLHHARWLLWTGREGYLLSQGRGFGYLLATLAGFLRYGEEAVLLFFLISGFCIHYRQASMLATARGVAGPADRPLFDVRSYAWRRFRRLYPPLLVALAMTALFDYLGARLNPDFYAGRTGYALISGWFLDRGRPDLGVLHSFTTLMGNLLFQSSLAVPAFGTDTPLWSLAFEFWFYVLYPVPLLLSSRFGARTMMGVVGIVSVAALLVSPSSSSWVPGWILRVLTYWAIWVGGALIAEAYVGRIQFAGLRWLMPLAVTGLIALAINADTPFFGTNGTVHYAEPQLTPLLWSASLGVLLAYVTLSAPARFRRRIEQAARCLAPLGDISYSLYLVHLPWLGLLSAWWLSSHERLPLGAELAVPGAISALTLGVCCWYLVERHFMSPRLARPVSEAQPTASLAARPA